MKVKSLSIENIGAVEKFHVDLNLPLILFYGQIKQGKTTILNAVRWAFGGAFPADVITHGKDSGSIRLDFEDGHLLREFYRATDGGEVKARPLTLVINGVRVARPVDQLKRLLNPFLLDQEHLIRMTELERKKYFADLFNTSTAELDAEAATAHTEAEQLRATIKGYGTIDLVEVKRVDPSALRAQLQTVKDENREATDSHALRCAGVQAANQTYETNRKGVAEWETEITDLTNQISALQVSLESARAECLAGRQWLLDNPLRDVAVVCPAPPLKDTTLLEEEISQAAATNVRAEQYEKDKARHDQKLADGKRLLELERRQRAIRDEKIAALDKISDASGIPGLEFTEDGGFLYEDTRPGMLSTSQLMKLSAALSSLYPDGIGLDLIDRGESLGTSIFEFVERAKAQNKTILATVVGEKPASVPAEVGVFVVEGGKVTT